MVKQIDHISRSAYHRHLEIRRISSIRHLLTTKATAQLMHSCVVGRLDYCNSLLIDISCDQMYMLQKVQNQAAKFFVVVVVARADMSILDHCSRHFTGCQSKTGLFFKISTFVFNISDGTLPSYLSSCLSVYTPSRTLRSSSDEEQKDGNLRALVTGRSLCSGSPCLEQPSCSHPTLQFSLTVQNFS